MAGNIPQPKTGRKLSRAQVQEILERNAKLYKGEGNLVPYLVELALYLLEYEYDWEQSGASGPLKEYQPASFGESSSAIKGITRSLRDTQARARDTQTRARDTQIGAATPKSSRTCLHCGGKLADDDVICPSCRNLTR